jgi:hypothetical protein
LENKGVWPPVRAQEPLDVDDLFRQLKRSAAMEGGAGTHIVRAILILGRSFSMPSLADPDSMAILRHERFFLDVLYVHATPGEKVTIDDVGEVQEQCQGQCNN